jgi:TrmH family RNA methyltransferase
MLPEALDRIAIVLVRARNPQNIGAVARAMHDFGFSNLRIVNEYPVPLEAARSAIDASAVLNAATEFPTVAEAIADCTLVVGTTAVGERDLQHPLLSLHEAAPKLLAELAEAPHPNEPTGNRVALLFGSEKTGLSNDELSHCHLLLTIPMALHADLRHPSMNLGQAVAVCLYELVRTRTLPHTGRPSTAPNAAESERLLTLFTEVLEASGYTRHHPARSAASDLRRFLLRAQIDRTDIVVWLGILRQLLWKLRKQT